MEERSQHPPLPSITPDAVPAAHTRIHLALGDRQLGAFDIAEVNAKLRTGELPALGMLGWYHGQREWVSLDRIPGVHMPIAPPQFGGAAPQVGTPSVAGDATGGVIPYKNAPALVGYYAGIGSLIPVLGFVVGPVAVVLGIIGLQRRAAQPAVRGAVHAWVAIILGAGSFFVHLVIIVAMAVR